MASVVLNRLSLVCLLPVNHHSLLVIPASSLAHPEVLPGQEGQSFLLQILLLVQFYKRTLKRLDDGATDLVSLFG